ncbi:MAG: hypothetical protein KIH69_009140 [Anaerolineae bacterium]|nr:hypothetical protein [Anaerolineae bacterium]
MQSLPNLVSNKKLLIGAIASSMVLVLSACTLSPLVDWQPTVPDSLAIENRQLRVNDVNGQNVISRRGGQRNSNDGEATPNANEINPNATPVEINNTQRGPAMPIAPTAPAPAAKIVPPAAPAKVIPKNNAMGSGAVVARVPSPTPRPMGGGGSKPITGVVTDPKPKPTLAPAPDIFDPANSPYANPPVADAEVRPTPKYPSKPVIYLPAKVVATPAASAAPQIDTPVTPVVAPTDTASTSIYGKGASVTITPTPKTK